MGTNIGVHLKRAITLILTLVLSWSCWSEPSWARDLPTTTSDPGAAASIQPYLDRVASKVTEFTLKNGLKFIVLERHKAPVIAFHTYADVGGANEPDGQTGVAHYLEHLAFKGTQRIGTRNYAQEKPLLVQLDQLFDQMQTAKAQNNGAKLARLQAQFEQVEAEANGYVKQNEMGQLVNQYGGVGLNATTSADATRYFYSLPSNKIRAVDVPGVRAVLGASVP